MTIEYEPLWGAHVDRAIDEMIQIAALARQPVHATFNGVDLHVRPGEDAQTVRTRMHGDTMRRAAEYRVSPEGVAAAEKRAAQVWEKQWRVDGLMAEMRGLLDPGDLGEVIRWLDRFTESADDVDVQKPRPEILAWFTDHGFVANANTGDDYDESDDENVARYLIGQAMDGIAQVGSPHPMFRSFAARWLAGEPLPRQAT